MIKLSDTLKTYSFTLTNDFEIVRGEIRNLRGTNFLDYITYHKLYFEKECKQLKEGYHYETELHLEFPKLGNKPYKVVVSRGNEMLYVQITSLEEILELINSIEQLEKYAYTDQLTGALNRHAYDKFLTNMLYDADRLNLGMGLLFVDIDDLKYHNSQSYKHGDETIIHIANCISASIHKSDIFVRQGGDEFIVLFLIDPKQDFTVEDMAMRILKRVRRAEGTSVSIGGYYLKPGIVTEIAYARNWKKEISKYFSIVDKYAHQAKKYGKNRIITNLGQLL